MDRILDTQTNTILQSDQIIYQDTNGFVEQTDTSWRYIPISSTENKSVTVPESTYQLDTKQQEQISLQKKEYAYSLFPQAQYVTYDTACGIISKPILLTNYRYICMDAAVTLNDTSSVEFSIVDGTSEFPILPLSMSTVSKERLFRNINLRFSIDSSKPVTIYKNNEIFADSWNTFDTALLAGNDIYTISYTPLSEVYKVVPAHTTIQLKIVVYVYTDNGIPPEIKNIVLRTYGGVLQWMY